MYDTTYLQYINSVVAERLRGVETREDACERLKYEYVNYQSDEARKFVSGWLKAVHDRSIPDLFKAAYSLKDEQPDSDFAVTTWLMTAALLQPDYEWLSVVALLHNIDDAKEEVQKYNESNQHDKARLVVLYLVQTFPQVSKRLWAQWLDAVFTQDAAKLFAAQDELVADSSPCIFLDLVNLMYNLLEEYQVVWIRDQLTAKHQREIEDANRLKLIEEEYAAKRKEFDERAAEVEKFRLNQPFWFHVFMTIDTWWFRFTEWVRGLLANFRR